MIINIMTSFYYRTSVTLNNLLKKENKSSCNQIMLNNDQPVKTSGNHFKKLVY